MRLAQAYTASGELGPVSLGEQTEKHDHEVCDARPPRDMVRRMGNAEAA
jgi:hypothetical protein